MTQPTGPTRRTELVDRARQAWIRRLIDLSRRNNLLYFRDLKTGTLDLDGADAEAMRTLLAGQGVPLARLLVLPEEEALRASRALDQIRRRALVNLEEKGLDTLFMGMGMATWHPSDDGRPTAAAVLLMPVGVEAKGRDSQPMLRRRGELQVNPVLLHVLRVEHGIAIDPIAILAAVGDGEEDEVFDPRPAYDALVAAAAQIPGFAVVPRRVVGNFAFQKMAMVRDLEEHGEMLAGHDLIAALAGDDGARQTTLAGRVDVPLDGLDSVPAGDEYFVIDADSSQQRVVTSVARLQNGVIQGPPGTGKSQTIVNLVATLAAQGKRVLFVAEKRAALEVVLRRLEVNGLGHLALDLHGADISRRQVMERVSQTLRAVRDSLPVPEQTVHQPFENRRKRLVEHMETMRLSRPPAGLSLYDIQGELLRLPPDANAATRWRGAALLALTPEVANEIKDLLVEAGGFTGLFLRDDPSPWTGAHIPDGASAQGARYAASQLATRLWPELRAELALLVERADFRQPVTSSDALECARMAVEAELVLHNYRPELFDLDLGKTASDLYPATRGWLPRTLATVFNGGYRSAKGKVSKLRLTKASPAEMRVEVEEAATLANSWAAASNGGKPRTVEGLAATRAAFEAPAVYLELLRGVLVSRDLTRMELGDLDALFPSLAADSATTDRLPRLMEIERGLAERGAAPLVAELRTRKPPPSLWVPMFNSAWWWSTLEQVRADDASIAGFNGRTHDRFVDEFRDLDRKRLVVARDRVRRAHAERVVNAMNRHSEQEALIRREAEKKTRHLPLRRLLAQAPDVLTTLCPCWMASPLSVSQLLDGGKRYFDVVVFDEASQVLPEDAVPSLMRAGYAVVAGDRHQLPPTIFFADGASEEEAPEGEELATAGFESLLDLMTAFLPPWSLDWHYRSRDEKLIAFSNREIYDDRLVTFPSAGNGDCLRHVVVAQEQSVDGEELSVGAEVRQVVELVLAHASERPNETLGVIAMGIEHARRVEMAVDEALKQRPDLDAFFDQSIDERFFVKNLERVQGDERDAMIMTVGYGKNRSGTLPNHFGPLNQDGGERRLNVAVTRARRRMTVVSSFTHHDMDPERFRARGVTLLRRYLEYASSGGRRFADEGAQDHPLNAFESDVADALEARGIDVVGQWGASKFRIDLVATHPEEPGRFVLAIECDGATYHSLPTARDRDRTRQQVLEGLGWKFHRIWSTDWFMRRDEEIERAVAAYQSAIAPPAPAPAPSPVGPLGAVGDEEVLEEVPGRQPRPRGIGRRESIEAYSMRELVLMVQWIRSDGRMWTDEEILEEMVGQLGFQRRGPRIEAAIRSAIAAAPRG